MTVMTEVVYSSRHAAERDCAQRLWSLPSPGLEHTKPSASGARGIEVIGDKGRWVKWIRAVSGWPVPRPM